MIMLTAFRGKINSSAILVGGAAVPDISKLMLTNSFSACGQEMTDAILSLKPKFIISFGQKPDTDRFVIETAAKQSNVIKTNFNVEELTESLKSAGIPYCISENAGRYLCNHVYYSGLSCISEGSLNTRMIFIHVPSFRRFSNIEGAAVWLDGYLRDLRTKGKLQ